jgi:membrane protease YdiL (CAAX protease family)
VSDPSVLAGAPYPGAPATYAEAVAQGRELRAPRWGLTDVVVAMVLGLLVPLFVLGGFLALGAPRDGTVILLGAAVLPWIGFGIWPWVTTRLQGNGPRVDLGFAFRPVDLAWGVGGGLAAIAAGSVVAALTQAVTGPFESSAGEAVANAEVPRWVVIVFALCALIGAPIAEELAFRGLAFASLARWAHKRGLPAVPWAVVGSSLLFALIHLEPVRFPLLLTIGLVLAWVRVRTGRLGAPIVAHLVNNSLGVVGILSLAA